MRARFPLHGKSHGKRRWLLLGALTALVLSLAGSGLLGGGSARADSNTISFDAYTLGTIHLQDGWSSAGAAGSGCAVYDHAVVVSGGGNALRISNAVTSGCFGDQTFSKSLVDEAGETSAVNDGMSGGARQPHYEAEFTLASVVPGAQQPGLVMSVSPDRGDGARMSYLRFEDLADGIHVFFDDYQDAVPFGTSVGDAAGCGAEDDFIETDIATLDRTVSHTVKFVMSFVDGTRNDLVKIYLDGVLEATGTSWEDYFRYCEGNPTRTVDSLLFRTGGTAAPAPPGSGFLMDDLTLASSTPPQCTTTCYVDAVTGNDANGGTSAVDAKKTIQAAINQVSIGGTVNVAAGTYNEDVAANKAGVQLLGAGIDVSYVVGPIGGAATTIQVTAAGVVIDGFTITRAGNNVTDWNLALNSAGVAVQSQGNTVELRNSKLTGNRTGVDINNSNGNSVHNNIIDNNRTGMIFRNQTDSTSVVNNFITNNWTDGVLFLDGSGGTNVPVQSAASSDVQRQQHQRQLVRPGRRPPDRRLAPGPSAHPEELRVELVGHDATHGHHGPGWRTRVRCPDPRRVRRHGHRARRPARDQGLRVREHRLRPVPVLRRRHVGRCRLPAVGRSLQSACHHRRDRLVHDGDGMALLQRRN